MAEHRTAVVPTRVLPSEHAAWKAKAAVAGVSPSDLLRQAMARTGHVAPRRSRTLFPVLGPLTRRAAAMILPREVSPGGNSPQP